MGSASLTLRSCNATTIIASTAAGAGVAGTLTLTIGGQAVSWVSTFAYAAPVITGLVRYTSVPLRWRV